MALLVERARSYYVIREKQALPLGAEWPENAVVDPDGSKWAVLRETADGALSAHVLHRTHLLDAESNAERSLVSGEAVSVELARMAGKFAGLNLWESVRRYAKPPPPESLHRKKHARERARPPEPVQQPALPKELGIKRFHVPFQMVNLHAETPMMPDAKVEVVADDDDFVIEGYASLPDVDRDREIVRADAFRRHLATFKGNPVLLFNHDTRRSIGYVEKFEVTSKGFWVRAHVSKTAPDIRQLIREGGLRAFSVTYKIHDFGYDTKGIRNITEAEPLEVSVVVIPAGRRALFTMSKSLKDGNDLECESCGSCACGCEPGDTSGHVITHKRFELADVAAPWSWDDQAARELVELGGSELLTDACLLSRDGEQPRLPHHRMVGGRAVTVLSGVTSAMAQLCSKSYVMAEDERARAYRHLASHLEEFGIAAPVLEMVDTPEAAAEMLGQVVSKSAKIEEQSVRVRTEEPTPNQTSGLQGAIMANEQKSEQTPAQDSKPALQLLPNQQTEQAPAASAPATQQQVAQKSAAAPPAEPDGYSRIDLDTLAALEKIASTPAGQKCDGALARDVLIPGLQKYGF